MQDFVLHEGIAAALRHDNIDTDIIIPMKDLLSTKVNHLGTCAFRPLRYLDERHENPDFILNQPPYREATILISGKNFGCGSSREFAVNAIAGMGLRAIIAPSYGDIFYGNCIKNGVLPIRLNEDEVARLMDFADSSKGEKTLCVDLPSQVVKANEEEIYQFDIDPGLKQRLLSGEDDIRITLKHEAEIAAFQAKDKGLRPWVWDTVMGK